MRKSIGSIAAIVLAGAGLQACTEQAADTAPKEQTGTASEEDQALREGIAKAVKELNEAAAKDGTAKRRKLAVVDGKLVAGDIEDGLLLRFEENDIVPQAKWTVDCHDSSTGDIISSTDVDNENDLTSALYACTSKGHNAEWCNAAVASE